MLAHVSHIHRHLHFLTISLNGAVIEYIKIWDFIKLVAFSDYTRDYTHFLHMEKLWPIINNHVVT